MSSNAPKKFGICALCGKRRPITREHVPPKNLFLPPRPTNTITVPVCEPCNHGFHLDDEYFRVYVSCVAEPNTLLRRLWKEKVVESSFVRGGGLKARLNNDHKKLITHHRQNPIRFDNNDIIPDELLPLAQPFSVRRIAGVVEKMIRCLHFRETAIPMAASATFDVSNADLSVSDKKRLYEEPTGFVGDNGEFFYRRENSGEGRVRWLLGFYGMQTFDVYVIGS